MSPGELEPALATMVELFPEGFEEVDGPEEIELAGFCSPERARVALDTLPGAVVSPVEPGWRDSWRSFYTPTRIGPLWVGPPWETPDSGSLPVTIDPGDAFGTGTHATTRLCLELLCEEATGSVVDLGCGSGVLSIAALRLGFRPVISVDLDLVAVRATQANGRLNHLAPDVRRIDALADDLPRADLAVANMELEALSRLLPRIGGPRAILSGYLVEDALEVPGWTVRERRELDGWVAELTVRSPA